MRLCPSKPRLEDLTDKITVGDEFTMLGVDSLPHPNQHRGSQNIVNVYKRFMAATVEFNVDSPSYAMLAHL